MGNFTWPSNYLVFQQTHISNLTLPAFPFRVACKQMMDGGLSSQDATSDKQLLENMFVVSAEHCPSAGLVATPLFRIDPFSLPTGGWQLACCTTSRRMYSAMNFQPTLSKTESGTTSAFLFCACPFMPCCRHVNCGWRNTRNAQVLHGHDATRNLLYADWNHGHVLVSTTVHELHQPALFCQIQRHSASPRLDCPRVWWNCR